MRRRRRSYKVMVPVASMGDIAFLLIIFFMLVSNFMKQSKLELAKPQSPDIDTVEPAKVTVSVDKHGAVWVHGNEVPVETLGAAVDVVIANLEDKRVELKVDKDLPMEIVKPVRDALVEVEAKLVLVGDKE